MRNGACDMGREFDDILDECLERLAAGESAADCAARYPDHAEELAPLLQSAAAVRRTADTAPNPQLARARVRERLAHALAQGRGAPSQRQPLWERLRGLLRTPVARPLLAAFAAVIILTFAAGGTTLAASDSVPGEPLYWVKTTRENIEMRMQRSDMGRSQQHARLAGERSDEMHTLIERGKMQEAEKVIVRFREHITQSAHYAGVVVVVNSVEMPNTVHVAVVRGPQMTSLKMLVERSERHMTDRRPSTLRAAPTELRLQAQMLIGQCELWQSAFNSALGGGPGGGRLLFRVVAPSSFGP